MGHARWAAAAVLAAGCAAAPPPEAPEPAACSLEVRVLTDAAESVACPALHLFAGQRARVSILREESYVRSFRVATTSEGAVADAVLGTLHTGLTLEALVRAGPTLEYRLVLEAPRIPFREVTFPLVGHPDGKVQMPTVDRAELEGATLLPEGEERAIATLPRLDGPGRLEVLVRLRGGGAPAPVPADGGWHRVRRVSLKETMPEGTVVEGDAVAPLLAAGAVTSDLQWAASGGRPARAALLAETPYVKDWDPWTGESPPLPILDTVTTGLTADAAVLGEVACTLSVLPPMQTFHTSLGTFSKPVTIDLPEIRVRRARLDAEGPRLVAFGSEALVYEFRPGATSPEE